ncbi:MAG: hypothetical protein V1722_01210 [Candidatus Micrarchaeota archaeon]
MKTALLTFGTLLLLFSVLPLVTATTASENPGNSTEDRIALQRLRIPELVDTINANVDSMPWAIKVIVGDELINMYLDDEVVGLYTVGGRVGGYQYGGQFGPSLNIYTSKETFNDLLDQKLDYYTAIQNGQLRYEAVHPITRTKAIIAEITINLLKFFGL